jgi:putative ABC transport system permease protein
MDENWDLSYWTTWIQLSEEEDPTALESQFDAFELKHIGDNSKIHYTLQNLSDVYLRSAEVGNSWPKGDLKKIRLFSAIAFLIVLIAAINYIILSTAVSTGRAREIGIRKTFGAGIGRIRTQVLGESIVLTLLVFPLALLFMLLGKPYAEKLFQTSLEIIPSNVTAYLLVYLLLTLLIGLASGAYASSYLSRLKVLDVLKQKVSFGGKRKIFRSALIGVQLVIFCSFVSGTFIIRSQYLFAVNMESGHYKQDILQIELGRNFQSYHAFLNGVRSLPEVIEASGTYQCLPMRSSMFHMHPHFQDKEVEVKVEGYPVDYELLNTLGITLLEGRMFSPEYGSDLEHSVILNETAVKELGIIDPVGRMWDSIHQIIGVVKDFNLHSIHTRIPPVYIIMTDKYFYSLLVHYRSGKLEDLIPKLKSEWEKVEPDRPMAYSTIEEIYERTYTAERNLSTILSVAALFALLIAAFGLFGLTLFVARSRTKEIGIRKVFGSSEEAIVSSFLKSNFIIVIVAELLSIPITIYFLQKWLNNFPYRTGIAWWVFVIAFLIATVVELATVYIHSRRLSRVNPVESLRYE